MPFELEPHLGLEPYSCIGTSRPHPPKTRTKKYLRPPIIHLTALWLNYLSPKYPLILIHELEEGR